MSDNDLAYRYTLLPIEGSDCRCAVIYSEASSFNFPENTTTFLCPQIGPMTGWMRTKPSYEEDYTADAPMNVKSALAVDTPSVPVPHRQRRMGAGERDRC